MILIIYGAAGIIAAITTLYFAWHSANSANFWRGRSLYSGGIQFYLFLAGVSVPLLGTEFVQSPEVSALRSIPHFILFAVTFYFGFLRADKQTTNA
jgi:hypothetical protein